MASLVGRNARKLSLFTFAYRGINSSSFSTDHGKITDHRRTSFGAGCSVTGPLNSRLQLTRKPSKVPQADRFITYRI